MKNNWNKKGLVIGIFILFIGNNITLIISGVQINKTQRDSNDDFDKTILDLMKKADMPSLSVCIIKNDSVVWTKGYGFYNRCIFVRPSLWKEPTDHTIYMIGSISKTITATALLQLYEKGLFNLSDDVNNYLDFNLRNPNYPDIPITIEMLLSHQSSLFEDRVLSTDPIKFSKFLKMLLNSFPIFDSPGEILKNLFNENGSMYEPKIWEKYPPGQYGNYSNVGFVILGYLIERLTNQTYEQYIQENIFNPLNMTNTSFHLGNINKNQMAIPTLKIAGFFIPLPPYDFSFSSSAGGVRTTSEDLSHFLIAHMNNGSYNGIRILKNETISLMHKPISNVADFQYGLGWMTTIFLSKYVLQGHGGTSFGASARLFYNESNKTGIIAFWNELRPFNSENYTIEKRGEIMNLLIERSMEL